jgi:predicted regulator of Ras-like GTPase activity (Roadblock/LC7/MglB family)
VIVLSHNGTSDLQREIGKLEDVAFLSNTTDVARARRSVSESLQPLTKGYLEGVNLFSVLQLLEMERKTCTLRLSLGDRRATLWIRNGEIERAEVDNLTGDSAIMALVDWKTPKIDIENVSGLPNEESAEASRERKQDDSDEALNAAKRPHDERRKVPMANLKETLSKVSEIDGFIGACVVDSTSGMMLGSEGGGSIDLEIAAAGNTEVVRAKRKTMASLGLNDGIEDILITLGRQYHLIRPLSLKDGLFMYLVLDKTKSNLAMARHGLADAERNLQI